MVLFWDQQREKIRECLAAQDHSVFRTWDPVRFIPLFELQHWVGYYQGVIDTSERLFGESRNRWIKAMAPRNWGFDDDYYRLTEVILRLREKEIGTTTYNCKSNHHIETYFQLTGKDVGSYDRIVEFGGGTGDLARLILDCGFEGEYTIVDFPEVSKIQQINFQDSLKKPLLTGEIPLKKQNTLLISTWALSEVPIVLREEVMNKVDPDAWLITTQRNIFDVDNEAYFSNWDGARREIPWIRWDGGSYYIAK